MKRKTWLLPLNCLYDKNSLKLQQTHVIFFITFVQIRVSSFNHSHTHTLHSSIIHETCFHHPLKFSSNPSWSTSHGLSTTETGRSSIELEICLWISQPQIQWICWMTNNEIRDGFKSWNSRENLILSIKIF